MPVTTRLQAEQEESPSGSQTQGDDENQKSATPPMFDKYEKYHPVFCLTQVSDEYINELMSYTDEDSPCLEITSDHPDNALEEILSSLGMHRPMPFVGWTVDQVYEFFKSHLRPPEDSFGHGTHFTSFTFLAVDEACLQSTPWETIVCCDSPDFGEEEIVFKHRRLSLEKAVEYLSELEQLSFTMSAIDHPSDLTLSIFPYPTLVPVHDQPGLYRPATAEEARENKMAAIRHFKTADEAFGELQQRESD